MCCCVLQNFEAMLEESKDIRPSTKYSQARTLFEDDSRWKVSCTRLLTFGQEETLPAGTTAY